MLQRNLFWQTRRLTDAREDHLTYFLAAALEHDPTFRHEYEQVVLGAMSRDDSLPKIAEVDTQVGFPGFRCVPDMVLALTDGRHIACEHKLEAAETILLQDDTSEPREQLERYVELPVKGVAYFRSRLKKVSPEVLDHPRYMHPVNRTHFLWRDLYGALSKGDHQITRWLFEGFQRLGFAPPVPHVGVLRLVGSDEVDPEEVTTTSCSA